MKINLMDHDDPGQGSNDFIDNVFMSFTPGKLPVGTTLKVAWRPLPSDNIL